MHYDDAWADANAEVLRKKEKAANDRKTLLEQLSMESMVKIMFEDFLRRQADYKVSELWEKYIGNKEV